MGLHTTEIGHGEKRVAFLHGLLGQGKNFATVAKMLGDVATTTLVDLPNHGRSAWTSCFDYPLMADIVTDTLIEAGAGKQPITLIGHSMGGKVAMQLALDYPGLLDHLVVIDIAPLDSPDTRSYAHYTQALLNLDLNSLTDRASADAALAPAVPDPDVRAFLLQNLHRGDPWRWLPNLTLLDNSMNQIAGWGAQERSWQGPVLWLAGGKSTHVGAHQLPLMRALFPKAELVTIPDAGHWVHAQAPRETAEAIRSFITSEPRRS